ncbi:signal recognition particle-docking protein FtsY [Phytohalomonas tamaricis]|uniref:signal recognition particle-docking protein FtsY n=1 Tax=Phytohalomonas tamaricis TaxID=2081032 RepID=UPI000D0B9F13|nr:signal recognition particle-docking protein FtsY [Phytohalomonas tamaricis]
MFGFFKRKKQDQKQREEELKRQQEEEARQQEQLQETALEEEATAVEEQEDELLDMGEPEQARQPQDNRRHPAQGGEPSLGFDETAKAHAERDENAEDEVGQEAPRIPADDPATAAEIAHSEEPAATSEREDVTLHSPEPESRADVPVSRPIPGATSVIDDDVTSAKREEDRRAAKRVEQETPPMPTPQAAPTEAEDAPKKGWFARIRDGLGKTRANLTGGLATLFLGHKEIDDELMEELETRLLMADVGIEATTEIIDNLTARISRREVDNAQALYRALQQELTTMLTPVAKDLKLPPKGQGPFVILTVGVNGVGKTTTIGKMAKRFQHQGYSVMMAAGDTFRAAAVEQLKVWGERNKVPVIAQHTGADSASVIYDAVSAAKARGVDILIADTAGRLHNKGHLMEELKKVQRVMAKLDATAPHEVMLVLDAGTGQNAISQAQTFNEAVPVTGITLTKLDGTAKGGIIFALAKQLDIPIRYIGVGETLDDLRPFDADDFVQALFAQDNE